MTDRFKLIKSISSKWWRLLPFKNSGYYLWLGAKRETIQLPENAQLKAEANGSSAAPKSDSWEDTVSWQLRILCRGAGWLNGSDGVGKEVYPEPDPGMAKVQSKAFTLGLESLTWF